MRINLFGIEVTDEDILHALKFISERRNKDKNEICLALTLMNENIQSWYSHFNHLFSKEIARQLSGKTFEETSDVSGKVIEFVNRTEAVLRANESVEYMVDLCTDYKWRDKKQVKGVDPDKAAIIANRITLFIGTARGDKQRWLEESIRKHKWDVLAEDINNTIHKLADFSEEIRQLTGSMQHDIECDTESTRRLYLQLSKKTAQAS